MIPLHLNSSAPFENLKKDPYAFSEVFSPNKDFQVTLVRELPECNVLIYEKKFNSTAEMSFVMYIDGEVKDADLKKFMRLYKKFVLSLQSRNFREVEPLIIAKSYSDKVIKIIEEYNSKYEKRKSFRLFTYK